MDEVYRAKANLCLRIQVASVGVISEVGNSVLANAAVIKRIDRTLKSIWGEEGGLRIAQLIKRGSPQGGYESFDKVKCLGRLNLIGDGTVSLTKADVVALSQDISPAKEEKTAAGSSSDAFVITERIIVCNMTEEQALMFNAPIGKDVWEKVNRIVIKENTAQGQSTMFNYPISFKVAKHFTGSQGTKIAAAERKEAEMLERDKTLEEERKVRSKELVERKKMEDRKRGKSRK
jgi:hypothetical protein